MSEAAFCSCSCIHACEWAPADGERVTLMTFKNDGSEKIVMDRWDEPRPWKSERVWKAVTLLEEEDEECP